MVTFLTADQNGFLLLAEDGAILASGGDLENDEKTGAIIYDLINITNS